MNVNDPLFTEVPCQECNSSTPVVISDNIITVEMTCMWCESSIRHTFPRVTIEEVLQSNTLPDLDLVELSPQQPYEPNPQDFCPSCGGRIADFEWGGYEDETGQRGHTRCRNVAIQRRNAAINRQNAERLRNLGEHSAAEGWYRLADEADAAADRMETEQ